VRPALNRRCLRGAPVSQSTRDRGGAGRDDARANVPGSPAALAWLGAQLPGEAGVLAARASHAACRSASAPRPRQLHDPQGALRAVTKKRAPSGPIRMASVEPTPYWWAVPPWARGAGGGLDVVNGEVDPPVRPDRRVGRHLDGAGVDTGHDVAPAAQHDLVVLVAHLAGPGGNSTVHALDRCGRCSQRPTEVGSALCGRLLCAKLASRYSSRR
jgi:hypothetical protein